jgi:hypothetical protein
MALLSFGKTALELDLTDLFLAVLMLFIFVCSDDGE